MLDEPTVTTEDLCQLELPPLELRQGSRLDVDLDPQVMASLSRVSGTEGLETTLRETGLSIRVGYDRLDASLTIERDACEPLTLPVQISPLEWGLLASWDPAVDHGPPAREYGAWSLAHFGGRYGLFVIGGFHYRPRQFTPSNDVWFFDLEAKAWREVDSTGAPVTAGARLAEGPDRNTLLLFGGATLARDGSLDTPAGLRIFQFAESPTSWQDAPHSTESPGSYTGSLIRDTKRARWLSVCGADSVRLGVHCSVSEYTTEGGWGTVSVAGTPPPGRYGFHYALDEENDRVIIVAGQSAGRAVYGDTWALELGEDPPRWVQLFEEDPAVRRRNGAFAHDTTQNRLFVWGGTADGQTPVPGLSVLRLDRDQERWDHIETPDSVPPRASGFATYDREQDRLLMGFGNASALYTDLYSVSL